jgi:hypothetical protein
MKHTGYRVRLCLLPVSRELKPRPHDAPGQAETKSSSAPRNCKPLQPPRTASPTSENYSCREPSPDEKPTRVCSVRRSRGASA